MVLPPLGFELESFKTVIQRSTICAAGDDPFRQDRGPSRAAGGRRLPPVAVARLPDRPAEADGRVEGGGLVQGRRDRQARCRTRKQAR